MSLPIPQLGYPGDFASISEKVDWCVMMIKRMAEASQNPIETISDSYKVINPPFVPRRQLDALGATTQEVAEVLATVLTDMHQRGVTGGPG